jgi:hypothetical protein
MELCRVVTLFATLTGIIVSSTWRCVRRNVIANLIHYTMFGLAGAPNHFDETVFPGTTFWLPSDSSCGQFSIHELHGLNPEFVAFRWQKCEFWAK